MVLFLGLIAVAELTTSEVFVPQMSFSVSSAVCVAMLPLFGRVPAVLGGMVGGVASTLVQWAIDRCGNRRDTVLVERAAFNLAALGMTFAVAAVVYHAAGGISGEMALPSLLLPLVLASVSAEVVNSALVVAAVSLQTGTPFGRTWRRNVSWASPMNVLGMIVGGGSLAFGYLNTGTVVVALYFLPVLLTAYAYRLYVSETKAQMARIEELVAQRIHELRVDPAEAELA